MIHRSVRKIPSSRWLSLWLLFVAAQFAPAAFAQKPAPAPSTQSSAPSPAASRNVPARVTETLVDSSIADDRGVDKMLAAYSPKVRALDVIIGKLKGELK